MSQHHPVVADRKVAALRQAMGPVIAGALAERLVVEVMVNPDGKIWVDRIGEGRSWTGEYLAAVDADRILRLLADHAGEVVTRDHPRVSATLPLRLRRLVNWIMPALKAKAERPPSAVVTRSPKRRSRPHTFRPSPKTDAYLIFSTISFCTNDIANNINTSTFPDRDDIGIDI